MKWKDYAEDIKLFEKLDKTIKPLTVEQQNKNIKTLIAYFSTDVPAKVYSSKEDLEPIEKLKALLAAYPVKKINPEILSMLENILLLENDIENVVDGKSLEEVEEKIAVWKGDITKIKVDAIVNDANSTLLGNRQPFHKGVDSKIHASAGPRLREDCNTIIEKQGHIEYAGDAKITRAYCLPSKYVVHTVGPVVLNGNPSKEHEKQLLHCYKSVLNTIKDIEDIKT
ncbi:macro domain-containing protein, partial [Peptacetobacter sp.]